MLEQQILKEALMLPLLKRVALAEKILASVEQPELEISELWAVEAESRIDAYDTGEMGAISFEQVFKKYQTE
ncbi:MAG: addiction module protein [Methylococcales bacterium]|nr:addiction module protein [Methylococcales bacterium]